MTPEATPIPASAGSAAGRAVLPVVLMVVAGYVLAVLLELDGAPAPL